MGYQSSGREVMTNKDSTCPTQRVFVGIDAGSVSINGIVINEDKEVLYESPYTRHFGKTEESLITLMDPIYEKFEF